MSLDQATVTAIATAVHRARQHLADRGLAPAWDHAGIKHFIEKCEGEAWEVLRAAASCAGNPEMKTPALIPDPGPHWQGTVVGKRQAPSRCPRHPQCRAFDCQSCAAEAGDPAAGVAACRAALRGTR